MRQKRTTKVMRTGFNFIFLIIFILKLLFWFIILKCVCINFSFISRVFVLSGRLQSYSNTRFYCFLKYYKKTRWKKIRKLTNYFQLKWNWQRRTCLICGTTNRYSKVHIIVSTAIIRMILAVKWNEITLFSEVYTVFHSL